MCIFCEIIKGNIPSKKIYEDDKVLAILDISQITKGHTLILPKKHFEQIEIVHQIKEIIEKKEYTWEKDGKKIMRNKIIFSNKDKIKLHSLLLTPMPNEMRKDVK